MLFSLSLWGSRILLFSLSFKGIYHFSLTHPAIQPMFKKNSWKICFYYTKKCDMRYPSPNNLRTLGIQSKKEIQPALMTQKLDFTKLKNPLQSLCCINIVSLIFNVEWDQKRKSFVGIRNPCPWIHHNLRLYSQPNTGDTYMMRVTCVFSDSK